MRKDLRIIDGSKYCLKGKEDIKTSLFLQFYLVMKGHGKNDDSMVKNGPGKFVASKMRVAHASLSQQSNAILGQPGSIASGGGGAGGGPVGTAQGVMSITSTLQTGVPLTEKEIQVCTLPWNLETCQSVWTPKLLMSIRPE